MKVLGATLFSTRRRLVKLLKKLLYDWGTPLLMRATLLHQHGVQEFMPRALPR